MQWWRQGVRRKLFGIPGETLLSAAMRNDIDIEGICNGGGGPIEMKRTDKWTETTFGEGLSCFLCHVKIPVAFQHLLPDRTPDEPQGLSSTWDEEYSESTSRVACQIVLDKRHEGMVVYVPDPPPVEMC